MDNTLTKTELRDIVLASLGNDWRGQESIERAVTQIDLLYRAAHDLDIEMRGLPSPRASMREVVHQLRVHEAQLEIDAAGRVAFIPASGKRIDLSAVQVRRPKREWLLD